jgi:flagellar biosynthetic protein FliO
MDVMEQVTAVAVVLLLLGAALWWLRRRGVAVIALPRRVGGRRLECLERVALGPQNALFLVRLGDTELLVAASPGGCSLIHSAPRLKREEAP